MGFLNYYFLAIFSFRLFIYSYENDCCLDSFIPMKMTVAWRIPGMGEPGGLPSMGSHRVGHD